MATVTVTDDLGLVVETWTDQDHAPSEDARDGAIGRLAFGIARSALINEIRRAVDIARRKDDLRLMSNPD